MTQKLSYEEASVQFDKILSRITYPGLTVEEVEEMTYLREILDESDGPTVFPEQ